MSGSGILRPTPAQIAAADPAVSAWVAANAGSGKTRVLTQRVARLLLGGAVPERILCLTYTRAAAAEMQTRLFAMLGGWAMAPNTRLGAELAALEGATAPVEDAEALARARRLFARALETPGGLKIQTIHAFCDSLLRRFPLEAGVSPRFQVLDERQATLIAAAIRTELAAEAEAGRMAAFDRVAARLDEAALDALIAAILGLRAAFGGTDTEARLAAHFGAAAHEEAAALARAALARLDPKELDRLASGLAELGGSADREAAAAIDAARAAWEGDPWAAAGRLARGYTTQKGEPRSRRGFPVKAVLDAWPGADALTDALIAWAGDWLATARAREAAARARDLDAFARALLDRYARAKAARALLDFDDLVAGAGALLTRSDMAAWALWKLDRGIDHILVDEAQDTAPGQWAVIRAIAREFHAGAGARAVRRTLFAVGDEKQSIFSFQGAEPAAFGENRQHFAGWLEGAGAPLSRPALTTSFRSAPGILEFVDAVFAGEAARGLTLEAEPVGHVAHRAQDAARVDLWPLVEPDAAAEPAPWWQPVDAPPPGNAKVRLARLLAAEIGRMIAEDRLPPREGRPGRRVRPGDILVLVAQRDLLARTLIRELKAADVPVAGADRLSLAAELAVKDLMALVRVAVTPDDDLSLAALLRSPLCEVSEEDLFALANGRRGTLWQALMAAGDRHLREAKMLRDMAAQADFLRPYEFLERALIGHDGRCRLLARLGQEAEDPIDELLAQALAYEARETPSLAGFIAWIEAADIKVKREMEHGRDEVRVMTVHGAKGLEAPVVILPDTLSKGGGRGPTLLRGGDAAAPLVLWAGPKAEDDPLTAAARAEAEARAAAERKRLLYVALTRAEDWLILAGAGRQDRLPGSWYELLAQGADRLDGFTEVSGPAGLPGPVRRRETQPVPLAAAAVPEPAPEPAATPRRPAWLARAPREERPARLGPALLGRQAEEAGPPRGAGLGRDLALERGLAVHRLLERLPAFPAAERPALARRLLACEFPALDTAVAEAAVAEALAVIEAPFAAELFGPETLAEAGVTLHLPIPGPQPRIGRIDRLVLTPGRVLVVDFKSDAMPPAEAARVPEPYLVQLAAYRAGAAALWPGRAVEAAILWTATPALMPLDPGQLDRALEQLA
jgi:ATP-dependent helicase/nuclease subunit A